MEKKMPKKHPKLTVKSHIMYFSMCLSYNSGNLMKLYVFPQLRISTL